MAIPEGGAHEESAPQRIERHYLVVPSKGFVLGLSFSFPDGPKTILGEVCRMPTAPTMDVPAQLLMSESNEYTCSEEKRLYAELRHAFGCFVEMQSLQISALALGDREVSRFEEEIRVALSALQDARHAYVRHVLNHGCRSSKDLIPV
jgi:hypothetical protein